MNLKINFFFFIIIVIGGVNKEEREIQCDCLKIIVRLNMFNLVVIFVCKSFFLVEICLQELK
jgi:hypothetical protein